MAGVWSSIRNRTFAGINLWATRRIVRTDYHGLKRLSGSRSCLSAKDHLLRCLDNEIQSENLPSMSNFGDFETKLSGCIATLSKITKDGSMLQIQLDANNSVETMLPLTEELEESPEESFQPVFMPVFTVDFQKQKGSVLRMECTFQTEGESEGSRQEMDVADAFTIQSVSVIPARATSDQVYSVDASYLSDEFYDSLESYIKEQGVTSDVLADLLEFFSKFEQNCYIKGFLQEIKQFIKN